MLADRLLEHVLSFSLKEVRLPAEVGVLDPFHGPQEAEVRRIVTLFHQRFYADDRPRTLMLGINPGRLGAGSTGLPFTDTKRCENDLGIPIEGLRTHEPSSDFFYRMVRAAGGAERFYSRFYVHAVCPLGFVRMGTHGKEINLNYYDDKQLERAVTPFVEHWLRTLIGCGMRTETVLCIGTGKNAQYLERLNDRLGLFGRIIPLEHPRFVMQYKAKQLDVYIDRYLAALEETAG
ncbi:MAG TPA: uracil-DNA glycosylase family protein [Flavobacteriales bacterium]